MDQILIFIVLLVIVGIVVAYLKYFPAKNGNRLVISVPTKDKSAKLVKDYSTKKLKEIIEQQSTSYNTNFIVYAKNELIKRGEDFPFDEGLKNAVAKMSDEAVQELVERGYGTYELEYIEIGRREYLKRGFKNKNEAWESNEEVKRFEKRFPALRTISAFINFGAWLFAFITIIVAYVSYGLMLEKTQNKDLASIAPVCALVIGSFFFIIILSHAETIRVFIDIEENTRKYSDYYE